MCTAWCLWDCVLILPGKLGEDGSVVADYDIHIFKIAEYSRLKQAGEHFQEGILRPQCLLATPLLWFSSICIYCLIPSGRGVVLCCWNLPYLLSILLFHKTQGMAFQLLCSLVLKYSRTGIKVPIEMLNSNS